MSQGDRPEPAKPQPANPPPADQAGAEVGSTASDAAPTREAEAAPSLPGGPPPSAGSPLPNMRRLVGPHLWEIRWVRDLAIIAIAVLVFWAGYLLRGIITPVLIGLFLAYLFHPLITWAERRHHMPRPVTISILLGVLTLVVAGALAWLGPLFVSELIRFAETVPEYLMSLSHRLADRFDLDLDELAASLRERLEVVREDPTAAAVLALKWVFAGSGAVADALGSFVGATIYVMAMLLLIPLYFFYFAWKFGPLTRAIDQYIPRHRHDRVMHVLGRMDRAVSAYFRDRVLIALIMAVLFAIGWSPLLADVPYWLLLGLAAGVLSLVPYVGVVIWPLAVMLKYLEATSGMEAGAVAFSFWSVVFWPSVVYAVVQVLEGWILTPYIQGRSMEMSAVTILLVVFIGGAVGGLYGLLLCVPIAACIKILAEEIILPRMRRWARTH